MRPMRRAGRFALAALAVALVAAGALAVLFAADREDVPVLPAHQPDIDNGRTMFLAGGCLSCHAPAEGSGIDPSLPAGGAPLATPLGAVYSPNITPDRATGLGGWTAAQFVLAMRAGVSPRRGHLLPAFPYPSYRHMTDGDLLDLWAYLGTLDAVAAAPAGRDAVLLRLGRPFVGVWKQLALGSPAVAADPARGEAWNRGAYLVQGPGHCGECHTPRDLLLAMDETRFLAGGPHPEGKGRVPSLRGLVARGRYKDAGDLVSALRFGEMLGYENMSSGGMGKVQDNLGRMPEEDVRAIAAFLVTLE